MPACYHLLPGLPRQYKLGVSISDLDCRRIGQAAKEIGG
jgi:hypothetical protein